LLTMAGQPGYGPAAQLQRYQLVSTFFENRRLIVLRG